MRFPVFFQLALLVLAFSLTGCHSYIVRVNQAREAFYCNNLDSAADLIVKEREKSSNRKNADVMKLEEAMMRLCQGEFRQSETLLREVRDSFDALEDRKAKSAAEVAASMLTDDCSISYKGEDYEKVLIRVMLALNSLMLDGSDVRAYANQINMKQEEIIARSEEDPETHEKVKKSYKMLAIGPYLCGILDDGNVSGQQEQIREFTKVTQWNPGFTGGHQQLERVKQGISSQKGNGTVYVFALVGHGPYKVEKNAEVTQVALMLTDMIVSATSKHSVPPTIAPVPIPEINLAPCRYRAAKITVDDSGEPVLTEKITDVNTMAIEQFEVNKPWIIARAAARRIIKKAGIYGIKEAAGANSSGAEILLDLAGVLWEASEEADTRCWNLLPGSIQVARLELPAGEHDLTLAATSEPFTSDWRTEDAQAYAVSVPLTPSEQYFQPTPLPRRGQSFAPAPPPGPNGHVHRVWKKVLQEPGLNPSSCRVHVNVEDGRNSYVMVYFGDYGLIGSPHVNTP